MNELKRLISSVTYQLYANALLRCLLVAAAVYLLVITFTGSILWSLLAGLVGFGACAFVNKLYQDKKPQAIRLIHQTVGDAEYSLPLLTKPQLNLAEQLQLDRLNQQVQQVQMPVVVLSKAGMYSLFLILALGVYVGYPRLRAASSPTNPKKTSFLSAILPEQKPVAPSFESASLRIQPPAYTRLPETNSSNLNASSIVGATLTWRVQFSGTGRLSVRLVGSKGQELAFKASGDDFVYQDRLINSGLYGIKAYWRTESNNDSLIYQSDFYRLEARPDLAPKIEPDSKELYRYHYLKDPKTLNIGARISDDFSVTQTFIVATVARGSGENVKFREVKMPLNPTNFKDSRLTKTIDLKALNFAPGDELYYYWAAFDNRQPEPNFTKSDTYFVVYKDTTKAEESELATMAVNIMPEYFRSQRQIIIDTEKLIAGKKKMGDKPFKSQSNEIGFDQKALRLRYGQFLGEEFEKSIGGGGPPPDAAPVSGMAAVEAYMHKHDEGEGDHSGPAHAHHDDDDDEHGHDHNHGGGTSDDKDPLAALMEQYVHNHDDAETNTFHEQSTRSLLKMALENMWQSELHLRLYEPEKALPYEQEALKYLKLSQQKARSYVKKTGFDPPQTKEKETRLTGEFKNVTDALRQDRRYSQQRIEALVSDVLGYLDLPQLTSQQKQTTQQLGNALADQVVSSGLSNWSVLANLQKLATGKPLSASEKNSLKTRLYALSGASERTGPAYVSDRKLQQAFWQHLK
ncbi:MULTISPECIES: hypothetical protein [unclassified Spirosoma]|uniref:hypothetical protein n=1 Tax=unclassified Spirosoma TaxID=2621999 RepID=UPI0009697874|nr:MULTISPECIES: hypothetical protein [unclassified Spirosoma]MBN8821162.1 hypothetical protein [Spirosoma sp.]OJW79207.1 MAG: hypothetical protein BGO59_11715 [Spirosoma sp. 48-14]